MKSESSSRLRVLVRTFLATAVVGAAHAGPIVFSENFSTISGSGYSIGLSGDYLADLMSGNDILVTDVPVQTPIPGYDDPLHRVSVFADDDFDNGFGVDYGTGSQAVSVNDWAIQFPFTLDAASPNAQIAFRQSVAEPNSAELYPLRAAVAVYSSLDALNTDASPGSQVGSTIITTSVDQTNRGELWQSDVLVLGPGTYYLKISSENLGAMEGVQIDDLSVTAVPEPHPLGLALLGFTILLALRRRLARGQIPRA